MDEEPAAPRRWVAAPVFPWGPLLLVCAVVVTGASALLAFHSATRWRAYAALPPDVPTFAAGPSVLTDLAPTLSRYAFYASWIGFVASCIWGRVRREGRLGPRRPVPVEVAAYVYGTWALYFLTHQVSIAMARPTVITNAQNATSWCWAAVSWTMLCVSWGVGVVLVPRYDRVPATR